MISWSCPVCTFDNASTDVNGSVVCEMCQTPRHEKVKEPSKVTQQQTLFGTRAKVASTASKPRQRKTPSSTASTSSSSSVPASFRRPLHKIPVATVDVSSKPITEENVKGGLQTIFGLPELRPSQAPVVQCAVQKQSQLVVMATGGGKSLCYQLPACLLGGVTIVISPLIALMQDQVASLAEKRIPAACISSSQTEKENRLVLERAQGLNKDKETSPPWTLLYITPESIQTYKMKNLLQLLHNGGRLSMFAVDEAHCLSSWGHDFRPAYRKLSWLRTQFPTVPCMACTATATPQVIRDIQSILHLQGAPLHKGSFDRPNIFYKVKYKDAMTSNSTNSKQQKSPLQDLLDFIHKRHVEAANMPSAKSQLCSGIVYVHKRDDTSMITNAINKFCSQKKCAVRAASYHAGLKDKERTRIQQEWSSNQIQVAVATVAFGMGIDLAHVRYVIHWTLPKTVEGFYQESGRAGRDGLPSHSILYFSHDEARKFQWLFRKQHENSKHSKQGNDHASSQALERKLAGLEHMFNYCTEAQCRRNTLIRHFGGDPVDCKQTCDYCKNPKRIERTIQSAAVLSTSLSSTKLAGKMASSKETPWAPPDGDLMFCGAVDDMDTDWGDGMVGDLRVTGGSNQDDYDSIRERTSKPKKRKTAAAQFAQATSILDKYEAMECQEINGGNVGFVRFRSKHGTEEQPSSGVKIPDHFRAKLAVGTKIQPKRKATPTSQDHAKSAKKLQEEIASIDAERHARMQALLAKRKARSS